MSSSDDYKKLREEWYAKLALAGFKDIEQDDDKLKAWHSMRFLGYNRANVQNQDATRDYYYHAYQFLNSNRFRRKIHKLIWEQHVEGVSIRDIVELLTKDGAYDTDRNEVWSIIKHYRKKMLKQLK